MTTTIDTPAPTDAEILDAAEDFRSQYTHGGTTFYEFDEIGFARAVRAKWGAQPVASDLDDSELEDLAHSANQEALSCGVSLDVFLRLAKTVRLRAATAPQSAAQAQEDARDAARYRFLRDGDWRDTGLERYIVLQLGLMWDDKIDAAIAAQEGDAA